MWRGGNQMLSVAGLDGGCASITGAAFGRLTGSCTCGARAHDKWRKLKFSKMAMLL